MSDRLIVSLLEYYLIRIEDDLHVEHLGNVSHSVFKQRQEREQKDKEAKQKAHEACEARKEADRMSSEREKLKAQRATEDRRELKAFNVAQMVTPMLTCTSFENQNF